MALARRSNWLTGVLLDEFTDLPVRRKTRLNLDHLEDRITPATFLVDNELDSGFNPLTGNPSLRQAIRMANDNPGHDRILINITTNPSVPQVFTIRPATPLPALTNPAGVTIDATTQTGYFTLDPGNPRPVVELTGAFRNPGSSTDSGFVIAPGSNNNVIRGFIINSFPWAGIEINNSSNNIIVGNWIGTDLNGNALPSDGQFHVNRIAQVFVSEGSANNVIGGVTDRFGKPLVDPLGQRLDETLAARSPVQAPVAPLDLFDRDSIDFHMKANRNVLSGTPDHGTVGYTGVQSAPVGMGTGPGIRLQGHGTINNIIQGNYIGTTADGKGAFGNINGIEILNGAHDNIIGNRITPGAQNLITNNRDDGIRIGPNPFPVAVNTPPFSIPVPQGYDAYTPVYYSGVSAKGGLNTPIVVVDPYSNDFDPNPSNNAVPATDLAVGVPGSKLFITGQGLTSTRSVRIGGIEAEFKMIEDTFSNPGTRTSPALAGSTQALIVTVPRELNPGLHNVRVEASRSVGGPGGPNALNTLTLLDVGYRVLLPPAPIFTGLQNSFGANRDTLTLRRGQQFFVRGHGFLSTTAINLGGTPVTEFEILDDTRMRLVVPFDISNGDVSLHIFNNFDSQFTPGGSPFDPFFPGAGIEIANATGSNSPLIHDFQLKSGPVGSRVTVYGRSLWGTTDISFVDDMGNPVPVSSFEVEPSGERVTFEVPLGADTGPISLIVYGQTFSTANLSLPVTDFTVLPSPIPRIETFSPAGVEGSQISITGSGFFGMQSVVIGGQNASEFEVISDTELLVRVPSGNTNGILEITGPGGTATSEGLTISNFTRIFDDFLIPFDYDNYNQEGVLQGFSQDLVAPAGTEIAINVVAGFNVGSVSIGGASVPRFDPVLAPDGYRFRGSGTGASTLYIKIPAGTPLGPQTVTVSGWGGLDNSQSNSSFVQYGDNSPATVNSKADITGPGAFTSTYPISQAYNVGVRFTVTPSPTAIIDTVETALGNAVRGTDFAFLPGRRGSFIPQFQGGLHPVVPAGGLQRYFEAGDQGVVRVTGLGFSGVTAVRLGGLNASIFYVENDRELYFVVPDLDPGDYTLEIDTQHGGTSLVSDDVVTVVANPAPNIVSVDLSSFPSDPDDPTTYFVSMGNWFNVEGTGFTGVTGVSLGGTSLHFQYIDDTLLRIEAPVNTTAPGQLTISGQFGQSANLGDDRISVGGTPPADKSPRIDRFRSAVNVDRIDQSIDSNGYFYETGEGAFGITSSFLPGQRIRIEGQYFTGSSRVFPNNQLGVTIGGQDAINVVYQNDGALWVTVPNLAPGTHAVQIINQFKDGNPVKGTANITVQDPGKTAIMNIVAPAPNAYPAGIDIFANTIFNNGGGNARGIYFHTGGGGVNPEPGYGNDLFDLDTELPSPGGGGPNRSQNYPLLQISESSIDRSTILISLVSQVYRSYRVDLYYDMDSSGPSASGREGQVFLGSIFVPTDDQGFGRGELRLRQADRLAGQDFDAPLPFGATITAVATDLTPGQTLSPMNFFNPTDYTSRGDGTSRYSISTNVIAATGGISGKVINDLNFSRSASGDEPGVAGILVRLDLDDSGSGLLGTHDAEFITDANGVFNFTKSNPTFGNLGLPNGTHRLTISGLPPRFQAFAVVDNFGEMFAPPDDPANTFLVTIENGAVVNPITFLIAEGAPLPADDMYVMRPGPDPVVLTPSVLANDDDADGIGSEGLSPFDVDLNIVSVSTPILASDQALFAGTVMIVDVNGVDIGISGEPGVNIIYTPFSDDPNAKDTVTFAYTITDGISEASATVTIEVDPFFNRPPTPQNDQFDLLEDSGPNFLDVLDNDTDPDGDTLHITEVTQPLGGTVIIVDINGDDITDSGLPGVGLVYTPNDDFFGIETFTYTVIDVLPNGSFGETPVTANVTIDVENVPDPPVAVDDFVTIPEDSPPTTISILDVLANDSDPDGDDIFIVSITQPANGTVVIAADGKSLSYQPDPDYFGPDEFTYTISDGDPSTVDATATVFVTVTPVNDNPVAIPDEITILEDSPATVIDVLDNDFDVDGDPLTIVSVTQPTNGTVVIIDGGLFLTYEPNPDFFGIDTFTYTIGDGQGGFGSAAVTVTVENVNDPPVAVDDTPTLTEDDPATVIDVLANDFDPDGDPLTIVSVTQPANGTVVIINNGTAVTYEPSPDFFGTDTFTYTITDGNGEFDTATVTVTVVGVNDPPIAFDNTFTVLEDSPPTVLNVLGNDFDVENDPLRIISVTQPANGTVVIINNGTALTYQPNPDFFGTDTFTYTISDGGGPDSVSTATVLINVLPVDDPPVAVDDTINVSQGAGAVTIDVLANDFDPDGDPISIQSVTQPANGTVVITEGGLFLTYEPNPGFFGTETFTYTIIANGETATATVSVNVQSVPRPSVDQNRVDQYAIGAGPGGGSNVTVFGPNNQPLYTINAFPGLVSTPGGSRPIMADVTGDGVPDLIVVTGPGVPTRLNVFSGATQQLILSKDIFEESFTGGLYVAAADITGDGVADIVVSPDEGGGPRIRIFNGSTGEQILDFFGIDDPDFRGGARVSFGDLNGDGVADLIVAAGFGGGPRIAVYDGAALGQGLIEKLFGDFFVFEQTLRNGAFVTAGDLNGDGIDDLIVGGGPGGAPRVLVISGRDLVASEGTQMTQLANFFAGDPENRGGIRVAAKDLDGDGLSEIITSGGTDSPSTVSVYNGDTIPTDGQPPVDDSFLAFGPSFLNGVFVG